MANYTEIGIAELGAHLGLDGLNSCKGYEVEPDYTNAFSFGYPTPEVDKERCLKEMVNNHEWNTNDYFAPEESLSGKLFRYIVNCNDSRGFYGLPKYATDMPVWKTYDFVTLGEKENLDFDYDRLKKRKPFSVVNSAQISRIHAFPDELKNIIDSFKGYSLENAGIDFENWRSDPEVFKKHINDKARTWVEEHYNLNNNGPKVSLIEADMDTVKYFTDKYGENVGKYLFRTEFDIYSVRPNDFEKKERVELKQTDENGKKISYFTDVNWIQWKSKAFAYFYLVSCYSLTSDLETAEPENLEYIRSKIGSKYPDFYLNADFYSKIGGEFYDWTQTTSGYSFKFQRDREKEDSEEVIEALKTKNPELIKNVFQGYGKYIELGACVNDGSHGIAPAENRYEDLFQHRFDTDRVYRSLEYRISPEKYSLSYPYKKNFEQRGTTLFGKYSKKEYPESFKPYMLFNGFFRKACSEEFEKDRKKLYKYSAFAEALDMSYCLMTRDYRCCFWRFTYRSPFYSLLEDEEMLNFCLSNYLSSTDINIKEIKECGDDLIFMHHIKPWIWRPAGMKLQWSMVDNMDRSKEMLEIISMYNNYNESFWGDHVADNLYNEWIYCLNLVKKGYWTYDDTLACTFTCQYKKNEHSHMRPDNERRYNNFFHKNNVSWKDFPLMYLLEKYNKRFIYDLTIEEIESVDFNEYYNDWFLCYIDENKKLKKSSLFFEKMKYRLIWNRKEGFIVEEKFPELPTIVY